MIKRMLTALMIHLERNNVRPLKAACTIAALACLLLFAVPNPLNGQSAKPPSPKAQTKSVSSAASIHAAQPLGQSTPENDWREKVVNDSSAPVTIV